ncbi:oocyte-secreted protein 3-like [Diceros bicornis minor]|uniref:oocyte-secreted protein 3-like n=1 Tax=Diceros bicornis minor TaxID=77932 RepID=UPI0026EC6E01|nr:oocyte-secreted protein 3-like [Diceros bicornis minor]
MSALIKTWTSAPPPNEEAQGDATVVPSHVKVLSAVQVDSGHSETARDERGLFERVLVECSRFHFRAIAKRALFYRDELVGLDELLLGTGCQAIRVRPDELEFHYPVNLCGIVTQVFFDGTVIYSWLTYTPKDRFISAELRLECTVPSLYASPDDSNNTEMSNVFIVAPPAEHWFLIEYRYCVRCGYAHFRESWSTPFYGPRNYSLQRFLIHPFIYEF